MLDGFLGGLAYLGNATYWVAVIVAVLLATATGIIPGFSSILVMALAIPFIVFNISDPVIGIVLLATITGVNNTLDSIPAVLLGNPSAATQVTFLEGHQLAQRGLGAYTLGGVYAVSAFGGIVGAVTLAITVPVIRPIILKISFPEITMFALFGIVMVSALSRGAMVKGLVAGFAGVLFGTVGADPITGAARYTFDQIQLWQGLPLIAATIGLFGLPEMIDLTMTRKPIAPEGSVISSREVFRGAKDGIKKWRMVVRQSLFGVFLGAVPGVGASVIDWLSYVFGIFFTKDKSEFGKGSFDGVMFAESAQNSKEAGQAIPSLTLGVPGGLAWALVIAGMLSYNLTPGPQILDQRLDLVVALILTLGIGNLMVTMLGLIGTGQLAKLTLIPYPLIGGVIIPISVLAAFTDMNHWLAVAIVFAFLGIGLAMKVYGWPRPPLILGLILGPIVERNFQSAYSLYGAGGIFARPLALALFVLAFVVAYFFWRMGQSGERRLAVPQGASNGSADPTRPDAPTTPSPFGRLHIRWRDGDNLVAVGFVGVSAAMIYAAVAFPARSEWVPMGAGAAVLGLAALQLVRRSLALGAGQGEIMDIGMRSTGLEGARRAGLVIAGLLLGLVLISFLFGLRFGALAYALLGPATLMTGRWRWLGALIAFAIVYAFIFVVLEQFAAVIWPQPLLGNWILGFFR